MSRVAIATSLVYLLGAAPAFAQTPARQPGQATGAPQISPPPAQAATPQPPVPLPAGAKIGLVNLPQLAQLSVDGKAASSKVQALVQKKQNEGAQKVKSLQDNQTKLQVSGALMNEAARAALQKEIDRQQLEGQRFEQDAQAEINELQTELQDEFQAKLFPILQQLAKEKGLHMLLSAADVGAIWWEPGVDLTAEAIKRLDAATAKPAATTSKP